jgi:signal recognition particle subunit SRP54
MMGDVDAEGDMRRLGGIIDAMTAEERRHPSRVIDQSRRRRIAAGAGVEPSEVSSLVKQFDGMADVMKRMAGMGMRERMREVQQLQKQGILDPGGMLGKQKKGTGKRLTSDERAKLRKQREKEARKRMREGRQDKKQ